MTNSIWQTIAATPWWVYLISAYVLWTGFMATKPRLISIKALSIMPLSFSALSVMCMCAMLYAVTYVHLLIWLGTLFLGTGLGYLQLRILNIKAVQHANSLYLPGSRMLLISLVTLFVAVYYFDFHFNLDPQALIDRSHVVLLVFSYGLLTGLFLGRLAYALRCVKSGPYVNS